MTSLQQSPLHDQSWLYNAYWCVFMILIFEVHLQARYPLIQRVQPTADDATQGNATQAGGPYRYLLQANITGDPFCHLPFAIMTSASRGPLKLQQTTALMVTVALRGPSDVARSFASRTRRLPCHILVDHCCYRARSTPVCKPHFVAVQPPSYTCKPSLAAVCRHGSIREPVVYNPGAVQLDGDVCLCTGMCAAADAQQLCSTLVRVCIRHSMRQNALH